MWMRRRDWHAQLLASDWKAMNNYDKAFNALNDKDKFNIKDSNGKVTGSMTGKRD